MVLTYDPKLYNIYFFDRTLLFAENIDKNRFELKNTRD